MGNARTVTAADLITSIRYDLRDQDDLQYTDAELLDYINRALEMLYEMLMDMGSDLLKTGTGSFETEAGTETYTLADDSMGDFWTPLTVRISGYSPMELVAIEDRYQFELSDGDFQESQPYHYYLDGGDIGLLPVPDGIYTIRLTYFPNFVPLSATTATIPLLNLFNLQLIEAVVFRAKNREMLPNMVEASLMDVFIKRANRMVRKRKPMQLKTAPRFSR